MTLKKLLQRSLLNSEQQKAVTRLYEYDETILYAKMGAGKTIITLSAISELLEDHVLSRVLIIAPKRVCQNVWQSEARQWAHTAHLDIAVAVGSEQKRVQAIASDAKIVVINTESAAWFFKKFKRGHDFDGLVIDELSKFKNAGSQLVRSLRYYVNTFIWRVGLTGTPVSENFEALYSQALVIDGGRALGHSKQRFLDAFFYTTHYKQYKWTLKRGADRAITSCISHLIYQVADYRHTLPEITYQNIEFDLPDKAWSLYNKMQRDYIATLYNNDENTVTASNSAVLTTKLAQIASGFLRDSDSDTTYCVHLERLHLVERLVHQLVADNRTVVIVYWYVEDRERLARVFDAPSLDAKLSSAATKDLIDQWNLEMIPVLLIHPQSAGHGLNLARGGCDLIWYTPVWSRDLYEQTNARLHRTGQTRRVTIYQILARRTIDTLIIQRVEDKALFDDLLRTYLINE